MSEPKPPFLVDYAHRGRRYSFHLWAEGWDDAEARLRSIAFTGQVVGSDAVEIPTNAVTLPVDGLIVRLCCWWRNRRRRRP